MQVKIKDKQWYIDQYLKENLDHLKKSVDKKWDCVGCIDGPEGVAKSTLAQMIGYYLSEGTLKLDNIVFTTEQFTNAVSKAKPKDCIIFDEMVMGGMSADALTSMQKELTKQFTLIRKKQLFIILVIPYIHMLQKYYGLSRTKFLIHCYTPDWIERGYFQFFNYTQKNYLYVRGHKYWNYPKDCTFAFKGRFTNYSNMFIDQKEYEAKKDDAIKNLTNKDDTKKLIPSKTVARALIETNFSSIWDNKSSKYRLILNYQQNLKSHFNEKRSNNI